MRGKWICFLLALSMLMPMLGGEAEIVEQYEPTCVDAGYELIQGENGEITTRETESALGHLFGDWILNKETLIRERVCQRCGVAEKEAENLPRVDLYGSFEGMDKLNRVLLEFSYQDENNSFSSYAYTSWQGHSSLSAEKKNYTVRLFEDKALTTKNRMFLREGWQLEHKYILKANYWDATQSRNLISAHVWGQMVSTREHIPEQLRGTSNFGAVDGFPVQVWHDGSFLGLYTMNLHKDDDLYAMRRGERDVILICNTTGTAAAQFRAEATFDAEEWQDGDWEVEYADTEEDAQWAIDSFLELTYFVMDADEETFRTELSECLDVESAIDYLLFIYALGLTESADKDLVFIRYEDTPWIASVYDMEDAFGLKQNSTEIVPPESFLPEYTDGTWDSCTGSLLWDRLLNSFSEEIQARYFVLRESILSEDELVNIVREYTDRVPDTLIEADYELYPNRERIENPKEQMVSYIQERLPQLDMALRGEIR